MSLEITLGFVMIFIIGVVSLVGLLFLSLKEKTLDKILFALVAYSTGIIFASALLDLIPEAIHHAEELVAEGHVVGEIDLFLFVIVGFVVFFFLERFIYWFHGHAHAHEHDADLKACVENIESFGGKTAGYVDGTSRGDKKVKSFAILNLVGDGLHNFLDGVVIMVSFLAGIPTGIAITLAVLFHELPQEIGDFGVLLYGGFTRKRALIFNFVSAMVAIVGGLVAVFLSETLETFNMFILAFSGGGFIYIAAVELMPEILKEKKLGKSVAQSLIVIAGIGMMWVLLQLLPHA